jgi:hypothetical protein
MRMNCPRCGFNQPDDKYCANCGLDVESFNARPKPLILRILQNPNLYAFLIGGILVSAAFYIFLNQRTVGRQMSALLRNHFVMSKDAGEPGSEKENDNAKVKVQDFHESTAALTGDLPASATKEAAAPVLTQLEIGFFELSRENLIALAGKIQRDEGDWHVVFIEDAKTVESLQTAARKLPGLQEKSLQKETKEGLEVDAGDINPDLRSPYLAVGVDWIKNENLHWALDLQLPPARQNDAMANANPGPASVAPTTPGGQPNLQLTTLEGAVHFTPQSALLLVYDPAIRTFTGLETAKLEKSPLRVLTSDDFRAGESALVVWVRLK